jgi:hypothetical protein
MTGMSSRQASVAVGEMMMTKQPADGPLDAALTELHDSYVWHANAAVSAGRDDLAWNMAQEFPDEALELLVRSRS